MRRIQMFTYEVAPNEQVTVKVTPSVNLGKLYTRCWIPQSCRSLRMVFTRSPPRTQWDRPISLGLSLALRARRTGRSTC
jgi:hypothetical protein